MFLLCVDGFAEFYMNSLLASSSSITRRRGPSLCIYLTRMREVQRLTTTSARNIND